MIVHRVSDKEPRALCVDLNPQTNAIEKQLFFYVV